MFFRCKIQFYDFLLFKSYDISLYLLVLCILNGDFSILELYTSWDVRYQTDVTF